MCFLKVVVLRSLKPPEVCGRPGGFFFSRCSSGSGISYLEVMNGMALSLAGMLPIIERRLDTGLLVVGYQMKKIIMLISMSAAIRQRLWKEMHQVISKQPQHRHSVDSHPNSRFHVAGTAGEERSNQCWITQGFTYVIG